MKKYFIPLLVIIVGAIILALWFFIYKGRNQMGDWTLYKNVNQGFEIKLPSDWKSDIALDETEGDQHSFRSTFGSDNFYLMIEINLPGEVTPILPRGANICHLRTTTTIVNANIPIDIFSSTDLENKSNSCGAGENLLDKHSVNAQFCVNSTGETYPAKLERGVGEYFFACKTHDDSVYDIGLACEGAKWSGTNGQKACSQLFDKLLSTFKVSK